jgi:hypothetical protein
MRAATKPSTWGVSRPRELTHDAQLYPTIMRRGTCPRWFNASLHWRCNFEPNQHSQCASRRSMCEDGKRHEFGTPRPENCATTETGGSRSAVHREAVNKHKLLILNGLAPQAGFEPATLRLTAGFRSSCRVLPGVAACCWTLRPPNGTKTARSDGHRSCLHGTPRAHTSGGEAGDRHVARVYRQNRVRDRSPLQVNSSLAPE